MKVLHVGTLDRVGGAARATHRLMDALIERGVDSHLLVGRLEVSAPNVHGPKTPIAQGLAMARGPIDKLPLRRYPRRMGPFSPAWVYDSVPKQIEAYAPDVVHIGWICSGFMRIESLPKVKRPTVFTMHDMWPITGGCHTSGDCRKYETGCGACPVLGSENPRDLSSKGFRRKLRAWSEWPCIPIAPSKWLADAAHDGPLFAGKDVRVIPWCLDLDVFSPVEKGQARELLRLPEDQDVILFGAVSATSDRNKGYDLLVEALHRLKERPLARPLELLIFGEMYDPNQLDLPFPARFLGPLHDDISLRIAYSAADVTAVPSRQESFGQTASESLACGTPVVAFGATGLLDIVVHESCGYLAKPYEPEDFAYGLWQVLISKDKHKDNSLSYGELSKNSRAHAVESFAPERTGSLYIRAFEDALELNRRRTASP